MSHVKNVVSYSRLVDICTGYGGTYNPGHPTLQLKAMKALLKEAQSSLQNVSLRQNAYNSMINERGKAFATLDILANRVIGTLVSLQVPEATIEDARFYARLIGGKRATPSLPIPSEEKEGKPLRTREFTQLSYVARASNFHKLAQMVMEMPIYKTNEPELQAPALMEKAASLQRLNEEVSKARVAFRTSILQRNRILYKGNDAVVNNASAIKRYVKVAFGTRSGEAAQLTEISFTKSKVK